MNAAQINIKKNQSITVTVDSVAYGGKGIARLDNFVIFVRDALPGQHLKVKIIKKSLHLLKRLLKKLLLKVRIIYIPNVYILMIAVVVLFKIFNIQRS